MQRLSRLMAAMVGLLLAALLSVFVSADVAAAAPSGGGCDKLNGA